MSKRLVLIIGAVVFGALWVIGMIGLLTADDLHLVPTPFPVIIAGVVAMFSTVGIFTLGFVEAASSTD